MGVSHHPRGVMPISGTFEGTGGDLVEMQVQVHTAQLDAPGMWPSDARVTSA